MGPTNLIIEKGLEEYFFQQVRSACFNQRVEVSSYTEFYLVKLLSNFCRPELLHDHSDTEAKPLAIYYLDSLHNDLEKKIPQLKKLGDFTLYMTGFFQESLQRRNMDLSYFYSLGGNVYHRLHNLADRSQMLECFQETFAELATKFPVFSEIFCEIRENSKIGCNSDLLKLYERWLLTRSERTLTKLQQAGIFPEMDTAGETEH